jgi:hypothetical protein
MRILGLAFALLACLSAPDPLVAQQAGGNAITADQRDIGKVQTRIEKYDQALGVVIQLARPRGANVECNAVCYFPSSSKPIAWKCEPDRKCDLHCTVNPPVGDCN